MKYYNTRKECLEDIDNLKNYSWSNYQDFISLCSEYDIDSRNEDENWWIDIIDSDTLWNLIREKADEWDLLWIKNMIEDIDLDSDIWKLDWNWRAEDIDSSDCECLADHIIDKIKDEMNSIWVDDELREYLDWYNFVELSEIVWAIEDYHREQVYEDEEYSPSMWELSEFEELADEYAEDKGYDFTSTNE